MYSESIIFETKKPAKTFRKPIYLFLGIVLSGIGIYYFITQLNWGRPEEFIPLGIMLIIGLYFCIGHYGNLAIPNSKHIYRIDEYRIDYSNMELIYTVESNSFPSKQMVLCTIKGVTSFDYKVDNITKTANRNSTEFDPYSPIGSTSPSGISYKTSRQTASIHKQHLILQPAKTAIELPSHISNISNFINELNQLLAKQN